MQEDARIKFLREIQPKPVVNITGLTFHDALTILFIGLKLTGHIQWNWTWVLTPLWAPIILKVLINWWKERNNESHSKAES